jgi:hypothetical protein
MDKVSAHDPKDLEPATTPEGMAPKSVKSLPPTTPFSFAASERQDGRSTGKAQKSRRGRVNLLGKRSLRVWLCKIDLYVVKSSIADITLASNRLMGLHCTPRMGLNCCLWLISISAGCAMVTLACSSCLDFVLDCGKQIGQDISMCMSISRPCGKNHPEVLHSFACSPCHVLTCCLTVCSALLMQVKRVND